MADDQVLEFLRRAADQARYVTSVCTGSLLLAAAGLLQGYRATTHWMAMEDLSLLGTIAVDERVVTAYASVNCTIRAILVPQRTRISGVPG